MTVVEVPHRFLDTVELARPGTSEQRRYLEERGERATESLVSAFDAAGIETDVRFVEGGDATALIGEVAAEVDADVIVIGATRRLFDQSAWESVSARLMTESDRPVLVVPARIRDPQEPPS